MALADFFMVLIIFPHLTVYPPYPPISHIMVTSVMSYTHQLCLIPPCTMSFLTLHDPCLHSHVNIPLIISPFSILSTYNTHASCHLHMTILHPATFSLTTPRVCPLTLSFQHLFYSTPTNPFLCHDVNAHSPTFLHP